jgi:FixJ family two-component response regulator
MDMKGSIYLVDDDKSARKGLTRLLLTAGYQVHAYASSDDLLKSPISDKDACLILDARMPGLSGDALRAELAANGLKLPVIFVTADDDKQTRMKARALEAAGFFRKPVDGSALLDAVAWTLEMQRRDDDVFKPIE